MDRKIIHIDMDAFFASVEQVDSPHLKGKPVIVGGDTNRGVVATCSYEARKYGVHSAMPIFMAVKKCPNAVFLPVRYNRYKEVSQEIFNIFYKITDLVEPVSIDEAYLDITQSPEDSLIIGHYIKNEVMKKTGLTLSVGISYNKFLSKIASEWNKPNGIKVITKDMIPHILKPLSISKIHGIGKKSILRLNRIGIFTIDDLLNLPKDYFLDLFGSHGIEIYDRLYGVDNRPIESEREIKSIGRETTLLNNTNDKEYLKKFLFDFAQDISDSLVKSNLSAKTITIKIKTFDFINHTKSKTIYKYINSFDEIYNTACHLLDSISLEEELRLIGLSVSNFSDNTVEQLTFL